MPFWGFEGPAGSGKTYRLLESVAIRLQDQPLLLQQKVLALTFMHGSRRRLDVESGANPHLRGKVVAMTIDSFAHQVWNRWRTLARALNAGIGDFNETCNACGHLLEQPAVARWVARLYPVVMVDEAQELAAPRLRMISSLTPHSAVFVAADEFQCLDEEVDTGPFMAWFNGGEVTHLNHNHRTEMAGLLNAGASLRQLSAPSQGPGLRIAHEWVNVVPFKIGAAIAGAHGSAAVLYPPAGAAWAQAIAVRLAQGLHSANYNIPPITLAHEPRVSDEVNATMAAFTGLAGASLHDVNTRLAQVENPPRWLSQVQVSVLRSAQKQGKIIWSEPEIRNLMERKAANFRAYSAERRGGVPLLSIHQAKNRQFDHVIVLWPHGVPGSDEFKARLLYNGITRARRSCKVFAHSANLLQQPPFTFP